MDPTRLFLAMTRSLVRSTTGLEPIKGEHAAIYPAMVSADASSLADFFSNSMTDFSEDQDVEGALKKLGLRTMTDKMKGLEITLMPHQVLGVSFMLEKERDKKFKGGMLLDAMGLGKVSTSCEQDFCR